VKKGDRRNGKAKELRKGFGVVVFAFAKRFI